MIRQDILESQAKLVYLGIGSNLGNRKSNIEKARLILLERNIDILKSSSFYETSSWPDTKNQKFLNIVLKVRTHFGPVKLLKLCKKIELSLGRKDSPKNSPRECDIDILDYDSKTIKNGIKLPHPRMHNRNFVLFPLFELDKNWSHPVTKQDIKNLIFGLKNKDISSIKQI